MKATTSRRRITIVCAFAGGATSVRKGEIGSAFLQCLGARREVGDLHKLQMNPGMLDLGNGDKRRHEALSDPAGWPRGHA